MRRVGRLTGTHPLVSHINAIQDESRSQRLLSGPGYKVKEATEGVIIDPFGFGGGGRVEVELYDPTKPCSAGKFYKVRTTDTAAVTGVTIGAATVKATPGKFLCLNSTPGNPTLAAQVPQLPDPISTDPAATGKYWEFFCPAYACIGNESTEI